MASLHSYTFDNLSRINDDACALTERDLQNQNYGSYSTTNYFSNMCGMKKPIGFATSQPNIFYNGSHTVGLGGCNVDNDSNLRIGTIQTNPKCRISLQQRPFSTVPYLGRGPVEPEVEFKIQTGQAVTSRRTETHLTEQSHIPYHNTPLIPEVASTIDNPANLVESVADNNWVRGGHPSREISKCDSHYHQ